MQQEDYVTAYLSLGSNLGNRRENIDQAVALLGREQDKILCRSAFYETAAWGNTDQPSFYNVALAIATRRAPVALLERILEVERAIGRVRDQKWGPRVIDIDILLLEDVVLNLPDKLTVPHPFLHERKFVLVPLAEIAADVVHPVKGMSVKRLLEELKDTLEVVKLNF